MEPTKRTARIAGIFYLILILSGMFSLLYVPSELIVWEDSVTTIENIKASENLFRLGVLSGLLCFTCFIFLPLTLYKLLGTVNTAHAMAMVILALVSVPISYISIAYQVDVLTLIYDSGSLEAFTSDELGAKAMLLLKSSNNRSLVAHIFWGLWLFPFGYLVYNSGFLPKFLGIMLMLGCFGYLIDFLGFFLCEDYGETRVASLVGLPAAIGEIGICLWLLIIGIKEFKAPQD
ncbi:DUF4386 domain-containing protein [Ulvibacterium sp.]|uniref:DUF4386 domain-containing protein n=1 Tax=Ulvibacterium sp. TaxID=2665914 RepID=UPI002623F113|nr:DUF4386 domain-containing protein [Ulvibacterium sp.]